MIKSKTIPPDTSISQIFFAIAPFQITFDTNLSQTLIIYLQKGLQIIGSLKSPILPNNQKRMVIPFNDNILQFRIYFDKNTEYQWSIYKKLEDDSQQLLQSQKFSLKDIWKTVNQSRNSQQNKQRNFTQTIQFQYLKMNLSFYVFAAQSQSQINDQIMIKLNPEAYQNLIQKSSESNAKKLAKRSSLLKTDSIKSDKKVSKSNIQPQQKAKEVKQINSVKSQFVQKQICQQNLVTQGNQNKQSAKKQQEGKIIQEEKIVFQDTEIVQTQKVQKVINEQNEPAILSKQQNIQTLVKQKQEQKKIEVENVMLQTQNDKPPLKQNVQQQVLQLQSQQKSNHLQAQTNPPNLQNQAQEQNMTPQINSQVLQARSKKIAIIFLIILLIIGFGGYSFLPKSLKKKQLKGVNKFKKNIK